MGRPRRGLPGSEEASNKWRATMLEKYGGVDGMHRRMQALGRKGGALSKNGGFASDKVGADGLTGLERARIAGAKGGKISRRTKKDDADILAAEKILEEEGGRD